MNGKPARPTRPAKRRSEPKLSKPAKLVKLNKPNNKPVMSVEQLLQRKQLVLNKAKFEKLAFMQPVDVAVFDRNFGDNMYNTFRGKAITKQTAIPAKKLLGAARWTISKLPGIPDLNKAPWCLVHEPNVDPPGVQHVFRLEVSYKPDHWYPLNVQGVLPARDQQMGTMLLGKKVAYADMPGKTELGWRGNMILWDEIPDCKLYY